MFWQKLFGILAIMSLLLPLAAAAATEEEVIAKLEKLGHGVARLSDDQKFQIVVDRVTQNIRSGKYHDLISLIAPDYLEPGQVNGRAARQTALSEGMAEGPHRLNASIWSEIALESGQHVADLTIVGPKDELGKKKPLVETTVHLVFEKRLNKFWLVSSDGLCAKLQQVNEKLLVPDPGRNERRLSALGSSQSGSTSQLLVPKTFAGEYTRLNSVNSKDFFGRDVFQRPTQTVVSYYDDDLYGGFNEVIVSVDAGWRRVLAVNQPQLWAYTAGDDMLIRPGGVAVFADFRFYVPCRRATPRDGSFMTGILRLSGGVACQHPKMSRVIQVTVNRSREHSFEMLVS